MITKKTTAKIVVVRTTVPGGPCDPSYKVQRINGPAEVEVPARTSDQKDRTLLVGDSVTHDELKRLCTVQLYDVTVLAQPAS